jgi:hypothetical protein
MVFPGIRFARADGLPETCYTSWECRRRINKELPSDAKRLVKRGPDSKEVKCRKLRNLWILQRGCARRIRA